MKQKIFFHSVVLLVAQLCFAFVYADGPVEHGVSAFKAALGQGKPVLVKFGAPWCGPCVQSSPRFAELAAQCRHVFFIEIDTEKDPKVGAENNITSLPTLVLYDGDGKELGRQTGAAADIKIQIDRLFIKLPHQSSPKLIEVPKPAILLGSESRRIEPETSGVQTVNAPQDYLTLVASSELPVLVQYFSPECVTCKSITELLVEMAPQFKDQARVVRVNVNEKALQGVIQERGISILLPGKQPKFIFGAAKMNGQPLNDKEKRSIRRYVQQALAEYHSSKK